MSKASPRNRYVQMLGDESIKQFNQRLFREKRTDAFQVACKTLAEQRGISFNAARLEIYRDFPPLEGEAKKGLGPQPAPPSPGQPGAAPTALLEAQESDGAPDPVVPPSLAGGPGYWESLDWACWALGVSAGGQQVLQESAPSPRAWGLFQWAKADSRSFYSIWAAEGRKQDSGGGAIVREADRQAEEIQKMLREMQQETAEMLREVRGEKRPARKSRRK